MAAHRNPAKALNYHYQFVRLAVFVAAAAVGKQVHSEFVIVVANADAGDGYDYAYEDVDVDDVGA